MKKYLLTLSLASALILPATAQEQWTLQQCIDYALTHNISLAQSALSVEQAQVDVYQAKGALLPSLSFATNQSVSWRPWSQQYVNVADGTMTQSSSEVNYNGTYGLQAQWTIWNGGRNRENVKRAKTAVQQKELDTDASALNIEEQIARAYVQILYLAEAVKVNEQILQSTIAERDRAAEMVEVGTMARADLAQMEAQVSQGQYNVTSAKTQLASAKLNLKQLLQIVDQESFDVADPNISDDQVLTLLPSVADVYALALEQRPEIASDRLGIELADMDISLAKRERYPTVSMSAGINSSNTSGSDFNFGKQLKTNLSNSAGLTVSVPIFDNRQSKSDLLKAKLSKLSSEMSLANTQTELYSDIESIWLDATNAQQQYTYARANVASMQESYDLVSEQFNVGLKDIVALNTGRDNLTQAQQQLLQAKYTALLGQALLRFYQGQPIAL